MAVDWFTKNEMVVNPDKFQAIVLGNTKPDIIFVIDGISVTPERNVNLLGVHIDDCLKFDLPYWIYIPFKAARQLNVLKRMSHILDLDSKITIFKSFVSSNLEYFSIIWHFCNMKMSNRLENLQKRALRFVHSDFDSNYKSLQEKFKLDSLYLAREKKILIQVYKIIVPPPSCLICLN